MGLSLEKKKELVGLSLAKRQVPANLKLAVKLTLDVSSSMQSDYQNGTVQELVDRLLPVAMRFDDNESLECYAFGSRSAKMADIKESDFGSYVPRFLKAVPNSVIWTGTSYSEALKDVNKGLGGSKGIFGFGKKEAQPSYLMFVTDGDTNGDEEETEDMIKAMIAKKVYIQMIGIGRGSSFAFLKRMADAYDHVGFVTFPSLSTTSDQAMYEALLCDEFCTWIKTH